MYDCTLLVSSCDKYKDAWTPYFTLLKKYWPEVVDYKIVLSTETKTVDDDNGLNIRYFHYTEPSSWSKRLKECLKSIDTKYVILTLEDFFLQKRVDNTEIISCILNMDNDPDIACFYFKKVSDSYMESPFSNYLEATPDLKYRLNSQVGVWNKETLISLLDENENPWQFEINGSKRIADTHYKLYCHKYSDIYHNIDGPFPYMVGYQNGYGIAQGKWMWNNKKLFKKHGIKVNYARLGELKPYHYNIGFYAKVRKVLFPPIVRLRNKIIAAVRRD